MERFSHNHRKQVTPFDPAGLAEECFGGTAVTSKWRRAERRVRTHNAFVLFYRRAGPMPAVNACWPRTPPQTPPATTTATAATAAAAAASSDVTVQGLQAAIESCGGNGGGWGWVGGEEAGGVPPGLEEVSRGGIMQFLIAKILPVCSPSYHRRHSFPFIFVLPLPLLFRTTRNARTLTNKHRSWTPTSRHSDGRCSLTPTFPRSCLICSSHR